MMENDIFHCLVERERGEEKWWGPQVFSLPFKIQSLQIGEKIGVISGKNI